MIKYESEDRELPIIYKLKNGSGPVFLVIAGTHGNEIGPSIELSNFVRQFDGEKYKNGTYYIIPFLNPIAAQYNVRKMENQPDINRTWPDGHKINKSLVKLIHSADLVLDFHEAWGFNECNKNSLGQTLYANHQFLYPFIFEISEMINNTETENKCSKWSIKTVLPKLENTLDEYCKTLMKPYILIEMAGQNNVLPLPKRIFYTKIILDKLLKKEKI